MTVVLYSNGNQECDRMRQLLENLGEDEFLEYNLGEDFTQHQFEVEFGGHAEFPQVAIGDRHIGGMKDTLRYFQEEGLI